MKSDQMPNNDLQNNYQQDITFILTNTTIQNKLHLQREHSKLYLQFVNVICHALSVNASCYALSVNVNSCVCKCNLPFL
jgi:hypothetical protein